MTKVLTARTTGRGQDVRTGRPPEGLRLFILDGNRTAGFRRCRRVDHRHKVLADEYLRAAGYFSRYPRRLRLRPIRDVDGTSPFALSDEVSVPSMGTY